MQRGKTRYNLMLLVGVLVVLLGGRTPFARAQTCVEPPEGLVSWWPGDGKTEDIVDGNHGTLQNGATFANGMVGQAFSFDGVDAGVEVPDAPSLSFNTNAPISVELWAFRTGTNPVMHLIGKRVDCGDLNYQMALNTESGEGLIFNAAFGNGAATGMDLPLNTWTHLAGTFDGTTYRFYINGQLVTTSNGTLGEPNTVSFIIGGSGSCSTFAGLIDEVSIYTRALSAADIAAIFNAGSAGKCKTLPPCTLSLEAQHADSTLSLAFTLGTQEPAIWTVWLTAQNEIVRLLSLPLGVLEPPVSVPFMLPFVPSLGTVGILTTLTTPDLGILCSEFATVDTGPVSDDVATSVQELQDVLLHHLVQ